MAGKVVHIELPAGDTGRATQFWGTLMGWQFRDMDGVEYHVFEGEPGGAIYPSESPGSGPVVYFGSEDIDADVARVRELGGQSEDKQPIPQIGWYAHCRDTEGNNFSLFQHDESVPAPSA
jgi:predicted enzyme related to lactoylglutathione lyase